MGSIAHQNLKYHSGQEAQSLKRPLPGTKPYVVVTFGHTGVGISSLVNLISGHPISNDHPNAKTSAPRIRPYSPITFPGNQKQFSLYELPGFCGRFPDATILEAIRHIERQEGIDLFLYCLRAQKKTVMPKIVRQIRNTFPAPMIAVVTELERFKGTDTGTDVGINTVRMEDWWCASSEGGGTNGTSIERMCFGGDDAFDAHACVTTLPPKDADLLEPFRKRRDASEDCIRQLILNRCTGPKRQVSEPLDPPYHCLSALLRCMPLRM